MSAGTSLAGEAVLDGDGVSCLGIVKETVLINNVYFYSMLRRSIVWYSGPPRNLKISLYTESLPVEKS
jgi:hypothetical protein